MLLKILTVFGVTYTTILSIFFFLIQGVIYFNVFDEARYIIIKAYAFYFQILIFLLSIYISISYRAHRFIGNAPGPLLLGQILLEIRLACAIGFSVITTLVQFAGHAVVSWYFFDSVLLLQPHRVVFTLLFYGVIGWVAFGIFQARKYRYG